MAKVNVARYVAANEKRWRRMRVRPEREDAIDAVARRLVAPTAKSRYRDIERETGVPWPVVAVIHEREASQRWDRSIAQGDPWARKSTHVPKGRGPFISWREAALDALKNCAPYAARWHDWTYGGALTLLVMYNGLGYDRRGMPSPYAWASTDQYERGKYVSDGVFDPNAVDRQLGCAAMLKRMAEIDPDASLASPSKRGEAGGAIAGGAVAGGAAANETASSGMPVGRIILIVAATVVAAVAIYYVVRWAKRCRAVTVDHDEPLLMKHAVVPGRDREE